MKNFVFFISTFFLFTIQLFGEESKALTQEETLERLIQNEPVKSKYEKCVEDKDPEPWNCVWRELSPDEQQQVSEILGKFTDKNKKESEAKYENKALGDGLFGEKASPVMKELGDNLFDMFQKAMYGELTKEVQDTELRLIDHSVFYDIYKARISKEFIELVASFCLDSTLSGSVYSVPSDPEDLKKLREDNIKQMHENPEGEKKKFNLCITEIRNVCTHIANGTNCPKLNGQNIACANDDHTSDRACEVQNAVNAIKKSIAATEVIQEAIKKQAKEENGEGSLAGAITGKKVSIYTGGKMDDRQSVDTLTSISSGQLEEAMKAEDDKTIFEKNAEELKEQCKDSLTKKCKEFVLEGDEIKESKDRISEMGLRMLAMENRIKRNLDASIAGDQTAKDELAQFLKEEGISEEEIDKIIKDDKKVKLATDQIIKNYEQRTQAVINNLRNKLEKMVPSEDTDEEKLTIINQVTQELMDRPKQYQQLLHYSNIVSSYLTTSSSEAENKENASALEVDGDKNANRYTTAAAKELSSLGKEFADKQDDLSKKIEIEADKDPAKGNEGLISIGLDTINNFLYKEIVEGDDQKNPKK